MFTTRHIQPAIGRCSVLSEENTPKTYCSKHSVYASTVEPTAGDQMGASGDSPITRLLGTASLPLGFLPFTIEVLA